ncbi:rCG21408 [Rattus norvegicus]|uniref:RCG21408 n=1 Tax=Rattus norvegicus TaxID=10116 RepID=A6J1D8_RAT|nr:rCG21408 [Rattus norvegicus]
MGTGPQTHRSS